MAKANLKEWILKIADGEPIDAVVIGQMGWGDYGHEHVPDYETMPKGQLLTWKQAAGFIDYDFDSGYGSPECNAIVAWTTTKVITVGQYDGSTWPYWIPRNPTAFMPTMEGG